MFLPRWNEAYRIWPTKVSPSVDFSLELAGGMKCGPHPRKRLWYEIPYTYAYERLFCTTRRLFAPKCFVSFRCGHSWRTLVSAPVYPTAYTSRRRRRLTGATLSEHPWPRNAGENMILCVPWLRGGAFLNVSAIKPRPLSRSHAPASKVRNHSSNTRTRRW